TMDVSSEEQVGEARGRFGAQDYFGAVHLLEDLVAGGRAFADAHHLLGLSYQMLGQAERALASLDRALELNPRYVEAHVHRALVLDTLGRGSEASQALGRARELGGGEREGIPAPHAAKLANMHATLGEAYVETGAVEHGIEQYRRALELGPSFHDLRYRLARLLLETGRSLEAREELERVVAARPQFADARAALGLAAYVSGDVATARATWQSLARDRPKDPKARAYLSMLDRAAAQS
ncbi:MAG: tetratricopeptide repeat protein, partial [Gemmatimonadetes bacterium]|nr:tetratricopeptide repeat protein [Gemmatimonadota bacterium]